MKVNDELVYLRKRVSELEKQLDNLRLSRRVLMDLLEQIEKEKNILSMKLDSKNKNSKTRKSAAAKKLYSADSDVVELKNYIRE